MLSSTRERQIRGPKVTHLITRNVKTKQTHPLKLRSDDNDGNGCGPSSMPNVVVLSPEPTATPSVPLPHSTGRTSRLHNESAAMTTQVQDRWLLCPFMLRGGSLRSRLPREAEVRLNFSVRSSTPKQGKSWANTSMRRSSSARTWTFMSLRNALNLTGALASRQILASTCVRCDWRTSEVCLSVDMLRGGGPT